MTQEYLSDEIIDQIKNFDIWKLSDEQKSVVESLIINEKLKKRYEYYGLCKGCYQPNTGLNGWCQSCNSKHFQENFKNWTSGNSEIDKLIQESQLCAKNENEKLEWIDLDDFENIEYVSKGCFGTINNAIWKIGHVTGWNYETNQWNRSGIKNTFALKCLHNSKEITSDFLNEIKSHLKLNDSKYIVHIYGITKDSNTGNFMIVMDYAENGNLRQRLDVKFKSLDWETKLEILRDIAKGLSDIHKEGLIHKNFHTGNILSDDNNNCITDLGLCKMVNENEKSENYYGVLPYVAPEILRGGECTQASDVYSFGIIINEVINGLPPHYDVAHDEVLSSKICKGLRPKFIIKVPQLIENVFKQCVDADPSKRPTLEYLNERFNKWYWSSDDDNSDISKQIRQADKFNKKITKSLNNTYEKHPQAIYTSRILKFNNLPEPKNA